MCGRFTITLDEHTLKNYLKDQFDIENNTTYGVPFYNIAPSMPVVSIISTENKFRAGLLEFGLVPSWTKNRQSKYTLINAKIETIFDKKTYMNLIKEKRCVVLSDGYYEWQTNTNGKQPYFIQTKDKTLFGYAAVWDMAVLKDGSKIFSCSLLTKKANQSVKDIHHRMPIILDEKQMKIWLSENYQNIVENPPSPNMNYYKVDSYVSNPINQGFRCIQKAEY
jgi:putative SOS response-associated peptidase YedK